MKTIFQIITLTLILTLPQISFAEGLPHLRLKQIVNMDYENIIESKCLYKTTCQCTRMDGGKSKHQSISFFESDDKATEHAVSYCETVRQSLGQMVAGDSYCQASASCIDS